MLALKSCGMNHRLADLLEWRRIRPPQPDANSLSYTRGFRRSNSMGDGQGCRIGGRNWQGQSIVSPLPFRSAALANSTAVQDRLDVRPHRSLGYRTPADVFHQTCPPWRGQPASVGADQGEGRRRKGFRGSRPSEARTGALPRRRRCGP